MNISHYGIYADISQDPMYYAHLVEGNHFSRTTTGIYKGQPDIWTKLNNRRCKRIEYGSSWKHFDELYVIDERIYPVKLHFTSTSQGN